MAEVHRLRGLDSTPNPAVRLAVAMKNKLLENLFFALPRTLAIEAASDFYTTKINHMMYLKCSPVTPISWSPNQPALAFKLSHDPNA